MFSFHPALPASEEVDNSNSDSDDSMTPDTTTTTPAVPTSAQVTPTAAVIATTTTETITTAAAVAPKKAEAVSETEFVKKPEDAKEDMEQEGALSSVPLEEMLPASGRIEGG